MWLIFETQFDNMIRRFGKFIIIGLLFYVVSSCQDDLKRDTEDVWQTVEKRMTTWKDRDKNGQLEVYHSDFRRWMSDTLFTKETFLNDWELIDSRIVDIKIEKRIKTPPIVGVPAFL